MKYVSVVSSLLLVVASVIATDYCSPSLCSGKKHIGCGNNGAFSQSCPAGQTKLVPITESLKLKILNSHNTKRNQIANGQLPGFQPAIRMATMRWDSELAQLAALNVKTCLFQHDACHQTDAYPWSGQNLARYWWKGYNPSIDDVILDRIDDWWKEYKDTKQSDIDRYPRSSQKTIGHFTVMTAEKNVAVGCAAIRFPENGWEVLSLACNYAWTNIIDYPMYRRGSAASSCTTGKNPSYTALCSPSETYDLRNV